MADIVRKGRAVVGLLFGFVITAVCGSLAVVGTVAYWRWYALPVLCFAFGWASPLWPIIAVYNWLVCRVLQAVLGTQLDLPLPEDRRAERGVLQIAIANHPPTLLMSVLMHAISTDCGPVKVLVKGSFLLWPFIGQGGFAMGGFAPITRLRGRWVQWLNHVVMWITVATSMQTRSTIVGFLDGHRPSAPRQADLRAREGPVGVIARQLQRLLPPRAGGLWMLIRIALLMGFKVRVMGYFIEWPDAASSAADVENLVGASVTIVRCRVEGVDQVKSLEELQNVLNALWRMQDQRMSA